jgi:hypothetical protein
MVGILLLLPLVLAAGAQAGGQVGKVQVGKAQAAQAAPIAAVSFRIGSWGRPIDSWEVRADGSASHVTMVSDEGASFRTYRLEHRAFTITTEDFARVVAMAGDLPQPRLARDDCEQRMTDMPYGAIELERGATREEITFDVGCRDERYQVFVGQLHAMDELVTGWAKPHAPARIEQVGGS